ncbi:MAG: hypothetical protein DRP62_06335, partial [Planctomycetota bacterium]
PTAEPGLKRLSFERLRFIANQLGEGCEIIADFSPTRQGKAIESKAEYVLSMLKRRPCSLDDICSGLGIHRNEALKYISHFQQQGIVHSEEKNGVIFFSGAS